MLFCSFDKINKKLYVSIHDKKYIDLNQRLCQKVEMNIHIKNESDRRHKLS
jgi:hypothetical protein